MFLLDDLKDRGADPNSDEDESWPKLGLVCSPIAISAIGATIAGAARLLDGWPPLGALVAPLVSAALFVLAVHVVRSKRTTTTRPIGRPDLVRTAYAFTPRYRAVAKWSLGPLLLATLAFLVDDLPRPGARDLDGYVCSVADGKPVENIAIVLRDPLGRALGEPIRTDRDGFFGQTVGWSQRAAVIDIQCRTKVSVPFRARTDSPLGCPTVASSETALRHGASARRWFVECAP